MTSHKGHGLTLGVESTVEEVMVVEASLMVALESCSLEGPNIIVPTPSLNGHTHAQTHTRDVSCDHISKRISHETQLLLLQVLFVSSFLNLTVIRNTLTPPSSHVTNSPNFECVHCG